MANKILKLSLDAFLKMLHSSARRHKGLRHYTTMSAFMKMRDSGHVYFSLLQNSNDGSEYTTSRHYMLCFNYGKAENIALWGIYGVPRNESIFLEFPRRDMMDWLNSATKGELGFYGVEDKRRLVRLKDACPKVSICDVAYYGNNIFTHDGKNFRVVSDGDVCCNPDQYPRLAPYAKRWAWSYEHEVRVVIEFDKPILNSQGKPFKRIAVDFEDPLQVLREGNGEIRLGPWCKQSAKTVRKKGFSNANVKQSEFTDMIRFRTPCSECDKVKRRSCTCKHKNFVN